MVAREARALCARVWRARGQWAAILASRQTRHGQERRTRMVAAMRTATMRTTTVGGGATWTLGDDLDTLPLARELALLSRLNLVSACAYGMLLLKSPKPGVG